MNPHTIQWFMEQIILTFIYFPLWGICLASNNKTHRDAKFHYNSAVDIIDAP